MQENCGTEFKNLYFKIFGEFLNLHLVSGTAAGLSSSFVEWAEGASSLTALIIVYLSQ